MNTPSNVSINDTGYIQLPKGTIAQRPAAPTASMIRYNTDYSSIEYYDGTHWVDSRTGLPSLSVGGLVLYLDAGDRNSYVSGTDWYDLSGNGHTATLTNGAIYNTSNGGNIVFDGINDYVAFYARDLTTTATVEIWAKLGTYTGKMLFGWSYYTVYLLSGALGYNTGNADSYGLTAAATAALGLTNVWKHYVFEMRSDVPYTNNKIYVNGVLQTLGQQAGVEYPTRRTFNAGTGKLGTWAFSPGTYSMPMNCSVFRVYNRALTLAEIQQNFNAVGRRYGLPQIQAV